MNNVKFVTAPVDEVRLTSNFVRGLQFMKIFKIVTGFSLEWRRSSEIMQNVILFPVPPSSMSPDAVARDLSNQSANK